MILRNNSFIFIQNIRWQTGWRVMKANVCSRQEEEQQQEEELEKQEQDQEQEQECKVKLWPGKNTGMQKKYNLHYHWCWLKTFHEITLKLHFISHKIMTKYEWHIKYIKARQFRCFGNIKKSWVSCKRMQKEKVQKMHTRGSQSYIKK